MDEARVCWLLCRIGRPMILEEYRPDSCIASTRIGIAVLKELEVPASPLPVEVVAFNPTFSRIMAQGSAPEVAVADARAWSVGVSPSAPPPRPGGWVGHLVILTAGHFVDLSLDQLSRPDKNLDLGASPFPRPRGWPESGDWANFGDDAGVTMMYRPLSDQGFRRAPDWKRRRPDLVQRIVAEIVDNL